MFCYLKQKATNSIQEYVDFEVSDVMYKFGTGGSLFLEVLHHIASLNGRRVQG